MLREKILTPLIGESNALPVSGISLCLMIFILCLLGIPRLGQGNMHTYLTIGLLWIVLTISFKFIFGMLLVGKPFSELMKVYDITTGNLWLFVVLFVGISPLLSAKIKRIL